MAFGKTPYPRNIPEKKPSKSIEVDSRAEGMLEHIMQYKKFEDYSEAIAYLYAEWKGKQPSGAGMLAGYNIGEFDRDKEWEDPYRFPPSDTID